MSRRSPPTSTLPRKRGREKALSEHSKPPAGMERGDAAGEVAEPDLLEARVAHQRRQLLLRWEAADGLDEILIGRPVAGDDHADERQHAEGIELVERRERRQHDAAELEAKKAPAGLQHAPDLRQRRGDAR